MKDPEFVALRNKVLIGLAIFIVFITLLMMVMHRFFGNYSGKVYENIVADKTFVFLQVDSKCDMCDSVKLVLEEHDIDYQILTMSPKDRHEDVYKVLGIDSDNVIAPSLFYIKKGEVVSYLSDIDNENELNSFIDNYLGG